MATATKNAPKSQIDTSKMLRETATGGSTASKWYMKITCDEIRDAVSKDYTEYCEPDASKYMMSCQGAIDPNLVLILSMNLKRKLQLKEIELLGGLDGEEKLICQLTLDDLCHQHQVDSFDQLPAEAQKQCLFQPYWSLSLGGGALYHLLNVMTNDKQLALNDLTKALLHVKLEQLSITGNKFVVKQEDGQVAVALVSGKPWHISPKGEVFFGHGKVGFLEKGFSKAQADFEITATTIDPVTLMANLRKLQESTKQVETARRHGIVNGFVAKMMGKPVDLGSKAPIK